jgi:methanol metabolism-related c-type cytochrome
MGSSYAPALADSLKRIGYTDFLAIVASGRQNVGSGKENVMPSFGTNLNVMCYIDDLYVYLRARAQGGMPRGRPPKHDAKPDAYTKAETECMGTQ